MEITVLQRDVLEQTIKDLRVRYAGYRISGFCETWAESDKELLVEEGSWHGPYENFSVGWEFTLEKVSGDHKGPDRMAVNISPVFDVVFADIYPNVFSIEVGFDEFPERENRPRLYKVPGLDAHIWDIHYFYNAKLRDL